MKRKTVALSSDNWQLVKGYLTAYCICLLLLCFTSCDEIKSPETKPFIGENAPLPKQEFRWSNGKLPKSFDPARVSAAPETDVVRALYEGLTEVDSKDLKPIPAIAIKWEASEDLKIWTFQLRQDAKWSNGESVTAQDFVRFVETSDRIGRQSFTTPIIEKYHRNGYRRCSTRFCRRGNG